MSLRDDLLPIAFQVRAIAGELGLRTTRIWLITERWTEGAPGLGSRYDDEVEIVESGGHPPKVRTLTDEQLTVADLPKGTLEVGPITPAFSGGGTDIALLRGDELTTGATKHFRCQGGAAPAGGALYTLVSLRSDRALRYMLQIKPVEREQITE
jgi:hypothetical protein